jgi:hypothetical protein
MMKLLLENWQKYLTERNFDDSKFPFPQPASAAEAEKVFTGGLKDGDPYDDVVNIQVSPNIASCKDIFPTQQEVLLTNAVEVALRIQLGKLPLGGNIGAVISEDLLIMDGHHRWAGSWLAGGGDVMIGGVWIGMPAKQLVPVLAAVGDHFHPGKRNPGRDVENIFNIGTEAVGELLNALTTKEGYSKWLTPDEATEACETLAGSVENVKKLFVDRLKEIQKNKPPSWAPPREEMPVIRASQGEHIKTANAIKKGQVDIYEPYMKEAKMGFHESWKKHLEETILSEATKLPRGLYGGLEKSLMASKFWDEDNDFIATGGFPRTNMAKKMESALNTALKNLDVNDAEVLVRSKPGQYIFPDDDDPQNILHGGFYSGRARKKADVAARVTMFLPMGGPEEQYEEAGDTFVPDEASFKIANAVRHELVHHFQTKAQAGSRGIQRTTAFQKLLDDPKQVVDTGDPKYWDVYEMREDPKTKKPYLHKGGFKNDLYFKDYLTRHIEVDAYAHQSAESLLRSYGKEKALDIISKDFDLQDPKLSADVKKYKNYVKNQKKLNSFRSKVYTYIMHMTEED